MSSLPNDNRPRRFQPISQCVTQPVQWLWPGRLALGKLAMLDGDPDLGKSLLTLDLCARLTRGLPFPDGAQGPGPANVVVLSAEDGVETVRPRLQALGADLDRVFVLAEAADGDEPIRIPTNLAPLDEIVGDTSARLVVFDPVMSFLHPGILCASDSSVRQGLLPLANLAQRRQSAVLMQRHLNKNVSNRSLYRGLGSIAFLAMCRSGYLVARDPQQPSQCVLAQVKNNLAPPQPSLAYRIDGGQDEPLSFTWLGPSPFTADQLLTRVLGRVPKQRQCAAEFLTELLQSGPRTAREVWEACQQQRLSERTVNRAKGELLIRSARRCEDGKWVTYWLLPSQSLPNPASADSGSADLEPWLGPLREEFPPLTPLDEL
jgi:hypothetical protein